MIRMMTTCPTTGKPVFTGVAAENITRLVRRMGDSLAVGCDHCGDLHECEQQDCWHEID